MRKASTLFLALAAFCLTLPSVSEGVVTIYKKDNSWVDGESLKTEYIFGIKYYLLAPAEGDKVIRIKADDVFKVIEKETDDSVQRIEYHYKEGIEFKKNGFWDSAIREFDKVLSIDPSHVNARNNKVIVETKIGRVSPQKKDVDRGARREFTDEDLQRFLGMRDDQLSFLKMVSKAHDIEFKKLIVQAVDNWMKDYKDYKISTVASKDLPPLRYPLIPED